MKRNHIILAAAALLLSCTNALAYTCSIVSSPGFTIPAYVEGGSPSQQSSVQVSCTRVSTDPGNSITYTIAFDAGLYANRARQVVGGTPYYIGYTLRTSTGCTTAIGTTLTGTLTWPTTGALASRSGTLTDTAKNYAGCVTAGQSLMVPGTYSDSIGLSVTTNQGATATGTAAVSITMTAGCSMPLAPGTVAFSYTAFGGAVTPTTPFKAKCSNTHPYLLSVSPATGTLLGLDYSLEVLTSPGNVVIGPAASITGSGVDQNYTIRGTMAAGQSGTCSGGNCNSTANSHTLTITY